MDFLLIELSIIGDKSKKSYSDERINNWKYLLLASYFCNLRWFVVTDFTNHLSLSLPDKPCGYFFGGAPNPNFCIPSQFVSWSAQPLEAPRETYAFALHNM